MTQTIEQLTARVRELEEENARLKRTNSSYATLTKAQESQLTNLRQRLYQLKGADSAVDSERQANCELTEQLAVEQLNNKLLRDALQEYIDEHEECQDADDWMAMMCSMEAHHAADEALSQPSDTSALDSFVAEKVKDVQLQDIEQYLLQMAGISTAAIGYWKEDDLIPPAYDTPALRDVAKLYANYESRTRQRDLAVEVMRVAAEQIRKCDYTPARSTLLVAIKESEAMAQGEKKGV